MPYTTAHKTRTRERILDSARRLFTRSGYDAVTIDDVMAHAGLTRGGFYNHFTNKADLFAAAVESYTMTAPWEAQDAAPPEMSDGSLARWFIEFYMSDDMLRDFDVKCPLYGLPNDISRSGSAPRQAYTQLIQRTAQVFEVALGSRRDASARAEAILSLCVGAMLLASTTDRANLSASIRSSAKRHALSLLDGRHDA
ncbi:MAG: TetR/AcrR family transcriptional regulator [Bradyrhizobium sp.]|nr:TetR/AcrR family transcriptional regulator [Bradyrhizobium sp.]